MIRLLVPEERSPVVFLEADTSEEHRRILQIPAVRRSPHRRYAVPATRAGLHNVGSLIEDFPVATNGEPDWFGGVAKYDFHQQRLVGILDPQLWEHQRRAMEAAVHREATLLHCHMGTGKTLIALKLIERWEHEHNLVVCPLAVTDTWAEEIEKHGIDITPIILHDPSVAKKLDRLKGARRLDGQKLYIVNYESVWRDPLGTYVRKDLDPQVVIADEAHRIKSPGSRVSLYFKRLGTMRRRLALTGTPLANSPLDAYGMFRFLDIGIFGSSFHKFRDRYAVMGGFENRQVIGWQNLEDFAEKFSTITFEAGADVLDLPPAQTVERKVKLPKDAQRIYNDLEQDFIAAVEEGIVDAGNALVRLLRLSQITSGHVGGVLDEDGRLKKGSAAVERIHSVKRDALEEILTEAGDEPVVVFCLFSDDIRQVHEACDRLDVSVSELSGSRRELKEWKAGESRVLAVQIQSGGEGVDLTRARYAVYYSVGYSLAQYEQSKARIRRPGQERPVTYVHLIAQGTVDVSKRRALARKQDVVDHVLAVAKGEAP